MDKISKALQKLSAKEKTQIKDLLLRVKMGDFDGLDVKRLKAREDIFRIRKGKLRVIYRHYEGEFFILAIERRSENTYK